MHERHVLVIAAYGLTDEQAWSTPTASDLSIAFLLRAHDVDRAHVGVDACGQAQATTTAVRAAHDVVRDRRPYKKRNRGTNVVINTIDDLNRVVKVAEDTMGTSRHRVVGALGAAPSHPRDPRAMPATPTSSARPSTADRVAAHGRGGAVATASNHHAVDAARAKTD